MIITGVLLSAIIQLLIIAILVGVLLTYVPMPALVRNVVALVVVVLLLLWLARAVGGV